MKPIRDDPAARELKTLLCADCYQSLIDWIGGHATVPFTPCVVCAPIARRWLAQRQENQHS